MSLNCQQKALNTIPIDSTPVRDAIKKSRESLSVLLIEENQAEAAQLRTMLQTDSSSTAVNVTWSETIEAAIEHLKKMVTDVILMDYSQPDSVVIDAFKQLSSQFPEIPVIILTGSNCDKVAIAALKLGAQDYISKQDIGRRLLVRAMRYAIERHELQKELKNAQEHKLISEKLESMGLIAGSIAHDFNNLLGSISGNAELAKLKDPSAEIAKFLNNITTTCERGRELCHQLMTYSGKGDLKLTACDLNAIIRDLLPLITVSMGKKTEVKHSFKHDIPMVNIDSVQIRQIIMNLLTNAADALNHMKGRVMIETGVLQLDPIFMQGNFYSADSVSEWNTYSYVKVEDNGIGMTKTTIAKIFDPFFTTKTTGRGLGLAATLGIIRAHNGALKVASKPGEGSTFWFLLPASEQPKDASLFASPVDSSWQGYGSMLIADDEAELRDVLSHYATSKGFKPLLAEDGEKAVEQFNRYKDEITLVLLDMNMPKLPCETVYAHMTQMAPAAKILLMSGCSEKKLKSMSPLNQTTTFVKKPFRLAELQVSIQQLLGEGDVKIDS